MTPAIRLTFIAAFIAGMSFAASHTAYAQNTDDAHALCAQGGGDASFSGAGGPNVGGVDSSSAAADLGSASSLGDSQAADADPESGASGGAGGGGGGDGGGAGSGNDSAFQHAGGSDNAAEAGGGGAGAGLGGSDLGGGAGGCGPEGPNEVVIVRRLPVTGSNSGHVGFMGGAFVLLGAFLVATTRRLRRRATMAPDGLVWDAFGTSSN